MDSKECEEIMTLTFHCPYCNTGAFPHFKALLEHYWEFHAERKRQYNVQRKDRKAIALVYATTPKEAFYATGWNEEDCNIEEIE